MEDGAESVEPLASVVEKIASAGELPPGESAVAGYLGRALPGAALLNLQQLSDRAGVSTATVTRFAKRLGYSGFKSFNAALRRHAHHHLQHPGDRLAAHHVNTAVTTDRDAQHPGDSDTLGRRAELVQKNVQATSVSVDPDALARVVDLLAQEARPLYLAAVASGHFVMAHFASLLAYLRGNTVLLGPGTDHWPHAVAGMPSDAVVLASSVDRDPAAIKALMLYADRRGATTVLISNAPAATTPWVQIHLEFNNTSDAVFRSRTPLLTVLEALLDGVAAAQDHGAHPEDQARGVLGGSPSRADDLEEMFALLGTHTPR
ncbi:MAG: MurR/RpiR family transcriptional regulator [Kocuria sp.]|nr:MurR/RpiR family transcriptional regulator [Kocuria sp.]